MQIKRLFYVVALGLGLTLALLGLLQTARAAPGDLFAKSDGSGTTCSQANPCALQTALAQANDDDTIYVAGGSYTGSGAAVITITESITLYGGWDGGASGPIVRDPHTYVTTLDGENARRVVYISGDITPTLDGFTISGGDADELGGDPDGPNAGGGIYSRGAAPIVIHNIITGNFGCDFCTSTYGRGGGVYLLDAPATAVISDNLIANNVADESTWGQGGGIMLRDSDAQVISNTIEYNRAGHSAGDGGGIAVRDGTPTIADNDILHNVAGQGVQGLGGGIFVWSTTPATIERNLIQQNKAISGTGDITLISRGGGIFYAGNPKVSAVIRDNILRYNLASPLAPQHGEGGGMYLRGLVNPSLVSGNTLEYNVAGFNDDGNGGGIYVDDSEVSITDNHVLDNSATWSGDHGEGGGIFVNGGGVLIQGNAITNNLAVTFSGGTRTGYGGGVALSGTVAIVQDNWIADNRGTNAPDTGRGGGIYAHLGDTYIANNTIADNQASAGKHGFGGGLYLEQTSSWVESNTILDNEAAAGTYGQGGGVCLSACPVFTLTNNIVARNDASMRGSGVAVTYSDGQLAHNTIVENLAGDGVGVRVDFSGSDVRLYNNIIASQTVGISNTNPGSSVGAKYTLFEGNGMDYGAGVSSSYEVLGPAMLLPNYHLGGGSGAIDRAVTLPWVTTDIDGDARPFGAAPDVGADEATCLARVGSVDYSIIQDAIDAATPGQTVMVAEGVCYENLSITKTVTLEGGWTPTFSSRHADPASVSTIDGMGAGRVISITEVSGSIAPTVDGFTITGGDATGLAGSGSYGYDIGGGIYGWYADVTVSNCVVCDNVASTTGIGWGGGLGFYHGNVTLEDSIVEGNVAATNSNGYGGGVCVRYASATITGTTVESNTAGTGGRGYGGGLWLANCSATLQDNVIRGNLATTLDEGYGGGLDVFMGSVSLDGDVVEENDANLLGSSGYGGGINVRDGGVLTMDDVQVEDNEATFGGGVHLSDSGNAILTGSQVYSNTAGMGGGLYFSLSPNATLENNQIYNNTAGYGGGLWFSSSSNTTLTGNGIYNNTSYGLAGGAWLTGSDDATLTGNEIYNNTADNDGGGIFFMLSDNAVLENNVVVDNRITGSGEGADVNCEGATVHLLHTTLARNSGGDGSGLHVAYTSTVTMTNTILVSHTVGITVTANSTATLEATLWGDGAWANTTDWGGAGHITTGTVNVWGDPAFVDPDGGDYHLGPGSAAIDAGVDAGVLTDIDGDPRPIGLGFDIGADEAWRWVYLPLVLRNS